VSPRGREILRWGGSLGIVLAAHLGGAAALLAWRLPQDPPASAPAVLLELAPLASAPAAELNDSAPGPQQEVSEPPPPDKPVETPAVETETLAALLPEPAPPEPVRIEVPQVADQLPLPDPPPEVVIDVPPPAPAAKPPEPKRQQVEKPAPRKPDPDRKPRATQTTAPAAAPAQEPLAAAPPPGSAREPSPDVVRRWQSTLVAHLQRHKRYPPAARRDNEEGVTYLRFAMDRNGTVLLKRIERASGHRALDQETLDLVERAQPLPAPPADMPGERFEFVVPVQFHLR
jgi:protein TonB